MVRYVKCPRCELNYIDEEKQEYCDVCLAEIHGDRLQFADFDDEEMDEIDAELETADICPVCGINPLHFGEKVCENCKQETSEYDSEEEIDIENDNEWQNYLDEPEGDLTLDEDTLDEELDAEYEDDEDESFDDDDYFDDDLDSLSDLDDEDDEDEDDLDDEDDEDDDF